MVAVGGRDNHLDASLVARYHEVLCHHPDNRVKLFQRSAIHHFPSPIHPNQCAIAANTARLASHFANFPTGTKSFMPPVATCQASTMPSVLFVSFSICTALRSCNDSTDSHRRFSASICALNSSTCISSFWLIVASSSSEKRLIAYAYSLFMYGDRLRDAPPPDRK